MKRIKAPRLPDSRVTDAVVRRAVARGRRRNPAPTHAFTLLCALPTDEANPDDYVEALAEAGCIDATLGVGRQGQIALEFAHRAMSYADAVASAIDAVNRAIPGVQRINVRSRNDE